MSPAIKKSLRARSRATSLAVFLGPLVAAMTSYACIKPSHVAGALEVAEVTCILLHDQVDDESALARACGISDALIPEIRKILFARKAAAKERAKAASTACPPASATASATAPATSASSSASAKH